MAPKELSVKKTTSRNSVPKKACTSFGASPGFRDSLVMKIMKATKFDLKLLP